MNHSVTVILRGTERYHMERYLLLKGYHRSGPDVFRAAGLQAVFQVPRKVPLGSFQITEVEVCFEGDSEAVLREAVQFRTQFMTAGG